MLIWLIGGTQESAAIAVQLANHNFPILVTVTQPTAKTLYPQTPNLQIKVGKLLALDLLSFLNNHQISAVIDASHPYATQISSAAIQATQIQKIPYLRYERPSLTKTNNPLIIQLDSWESLITGNYLLGQKVLLTVGYQALHRFKVWQERAKLYARVLPQLESLKAAYEAGFTSDRLIAMRPPISADLEQALWQQWNICLVVTKASGTAGGEDTKQFIAQKLQIPLIIIQRPKITYPLQTSELSEVLNFCQQHCRP